MPLRLRNSLVRWIAITIQRRDASTRLTWTDVENISATKSAGFTRQWLSKNKRIADAYEAHARRHHAIKTGKPPPSDKPSPLDQAKETIRKLREEIADRTRELAKYDELLSLCIIRASEANIPKERLFAPLAAAPAQRRRAESRRGAGGASRRGRPRPNA